jgi:hypothetical protein
MKWLNLATLDQVVPDPNLFRGFNEQLRRDFSTEAQASSAASSRRIEAWWSS